MIGTSEEKNGGKNPSNIKNQTTVGDMSEISKGEENDHYKQEITNGNYQIKQQTIIEDAHGVDISE